MLLDFKNELSYVIRQKKSGVVHYFKLIFVPPELLPFLLNQKVTV